MDLSDVVNVALTLKTNYKTWLHRVCISHSHIFSASLYDAALLSF